MEDIFAKRSSIIIVAKRPVPGNVKTRLCPPLTSQESSNLYSCFLQDTVDKVAKVPGALKYLALDIEDLEIRGGGIAPLLDDISIPKSFKVIGQGSGDLGERLTCLTNQVLEESDRLIFVGADSPSLPIPYLESALRLLADNDVVIGPSEDGGYYLLGMAGCFTFLFEGVEWSSDRVFKQTLDCARSAGLKVNSMSTWYDVDTSSDLSRLALDIKDERTVAPITANFLEKLRW